MGYHYGIGKEDCYEGEQVCGLIAHLGQVDQHQSGRPRPYSRAVSNPIFSSCCSQDDHCLVGTYSIQKQHDGAEGTVLQLGVSFFS